VETRGGASLSKKATVEQFLKDDRKSFWEQVHNLPVAEVAAVTATGIHEWWEETPSTLSFAPEKLESKLVDHCRQYQAIYIDGTHWNVSESLRERLQDVNCQVHVFENPGHLRRAVLDKLEYDERTIPPHPKRDTVDQIGIPDF
jgi:hypothetical protein